MHDPRRVDEDLVQPAAREWDGWRQTVHDGRAQLRTADGALGGTPCVGCGRTIVSGDAVLVLRSDADRHERVFHRGCWAPVAPKRPAKAEAAVTAVRKRAERR